MILLRYRCRNVSVGLDEACCAGRVLAVDAAPVLGRRSFSAAAFLHHLTNASIELNEAFSATGGPIQRCYYIPDHGYEQSYVASLKPSLLEVIPPFVGSKVFCESR